MRAKRTIVKFDPEKVVLPLKIMSLGYIMVTLKSERLSYMSTPQRSVCSSDHSQFYLGVANRLFRIVLEDANLASDGHVEIPMQDADHVGDELPFVLQEGAVMTYGPEMKKKTDKIAIESFTSPRARE